LALVAITEAVIDFFRSL